MNKLTGIIVVILVLVGGVYLALRAPGEEGSVLSEENTGAKGRVVFSITDAAVNMSAISEINMRISRVEMHSQAQGWVTASVSPQTYNLLELKAKNESKVVADVEAVVGTYDQVRIMIDSVMVKNAQGVTHEANMPRGEMALATTLIVDAGKTTSVNLDFLADKSLHTAVNGEYIFAPVVKTETRSDATVNISTEGVVSITNGDMDSSKTSGMDLDGSVKLNFEINTLEKLSIEGDTIIKLEGILKP